MSWTDQLLTPDLCTEAEARRAALRLADRARRGGDSPEALAEVLECLGLTKPASRVSLAVRDGLGRSRAVSAPVPDVHSGETLCRCPGRKHLLTEGDSESTYISPGGQRHCRVGMERRRQSGFDPDLQVGERWCRCEGERHILTPYTSETTYVQPSGKRRCRVARRKSNDARECRARRGEAA